MQTVGPERSAPGGAVDHPCQPADLVEGPSNRAAAQRCWCSRRQPALCPLQPPSVEEHSCQWEVDEGLHTTENVTRRQLP